MMSFDKFVDENPILRSKLSIPTVCLFKGSDIVIIDVEMQQKVSPVSVIPLWSPPISFSALHR